jgi:hypothetical protein
LRRIQREADMYDGAPMVRSAREILHD